MLLHPKGRKWKCKPTSKECSSWLAISSLISRCRMDELVQIHDSLVSFACSFWVFQVLNISVSVKINKTYEKQFLMLFMSNKIHEKIKYDRH